MMLFRTARILRAHDHERAGCARSGRAWKRATGVRAPPAYSTVTFAAAATAFQMAMSFWMKAANSSGVLPTGCIA